MKKISESELILMQCLWESDEPLTLPEIEKMLENTEYSKWKTQTLSTFLHRMIEKGFVQMMRSGRKFYYSALCKREEYYSGLIKDELQDWLREEHQEFFMLAMKKIDKRKKQMLKELIDELGE